MAAVDGVGVAVETFQGYARDHPNDAMVWARARGVQHGCVRADDPDLWPGRRYHSLPYGSCQAEQGEIHSISAEIQSLFMHCGRLESLEDLIVLRIFRLKP